MANGDFRQVVASGQQPSQSGESWGMFGVATAGLAGVGAAGFIPTRGGGRVWDTYLRGIKNLETLSPGAVLRTFRISETLSPFASWEKLGLQAGEISSPTVYGSYLRHVLGDHVTSASVAKTGTVFGEVLDESGKIIGMGMRVDAGTQRGATIADYYARIAGVDLGSGTQAKSISEGILRSRWAIEAPELKYSEYKDFLREHTPEKLRPSVPLVAGLRNEVNILGRNLKLTSAQSRNLAKAEVAASFIRARIASTVGRLNNLLAKPFEVPVVGDILQKIPIVNRLGIEPGTHTQMLGRYVKRGIAAGAIYKGLEYYDYLRSEGSAAAAPVGAIGGALVGGFLFKGAGAGVTAFSPKAAIIGAAAGLFTAASPRFEHGLFHGAATYLGDLNLTRANLSEGSGMTESLRKQDEVTKGLVSFKSLLGMTGAGALFGGVAGYGGLVSESFKTRSATGGTLSQVMEELRPLRETRFKENVSSKLARIPSIGKHQAKIKSPGVLGAIAGAATWVAASSGLSALSGNFMAAIPGLNLLGTTEDPERLKRLYAGEEDIAVRKGRWWEFGRCLMISTTCKLFDGTEKTAGKVEVGDILVGRNYKKAKVLKIYTRHHNEECLKFSTGFDRDKISGVTDNHIIPICPKNSAKDLSSIVEKPASEIKIGDYVEIPVQKLINRKLSIKVTDIVKEPILLERDRVWAVQRNWYSKKLQRSGKYNIDDQLILDADFGLLLGYFLAEGNISFNNSNPTIVETVHAKHERKYVDDIVRLSQKIFKITPTVRFKKGKKPTDEGCWIVRICSAIVAKLYRWSFYPQNRYNKDKKQVPSWCMSAPDEFKNAFIEGYYRGDGHFDSNRVISSARKNILEDIQQIALSIGLLCGISLKEENEYLGRWKLRFTSGEAHNSPVIKIEDRVFAAIRSIEAEEYNDVVYDFEVDHPDHLFVAGVFLVHNSTGYEGGRILYHRPHWMHRLKTRASQKGIYGSEEERWEHDPMLHPLKALFGSDDWKYHHEQKYQYERPAPLTGTYFEDVPFIGPVLAATIGKMLKPRKYVRPEEWMLGEGKFKHYPGSRPEAEPAYELGGLPPGAPVSPEDPSQLFNELLYRRREAVGLMGFAEASVQKSLTGREEVFQNLQTMATMGKETGAEYWLWSHLQVGGAAGTSEAIRRFIPHERSYLDHYNPLASQMPSWMPKNYFMDYEHGNPFEKIPEAEIRLAGPGYASLHPEVEGLSPEEYPLIHRLKILSDVAMWSPEYKVTLAETMKARSSLSEEELQMFETIRSQVKDKKTRREFQEYRFRDEELVSTQANIREVISPGRVLTEEYGDMIVELQGIGAVNDMDSAMAGARELLEGQQVDLMVPALEGRRYDKIASGGRMKAAAMLDGVDYSQIMSERGLTKQKNLVDEFEQLKYSGREQAAGQIWESMSRAVDTPLELLTPMSPASKFIRMRSAIEEYALTEAIGTGSAFWDRPVENFIGPAMEMAEYKMGDTNIPQVVQRRRAVSEYFDMLDYTKQSLVEKRAYIQGDIDLAKEAAKKKERTLFGLNPLSNPTVIMQALPRRERDFFSEFVAAKTQEDREKILDLVPEQIGRVYKAQWMRQEVDAVKAKKEAGISDREDDAVLSTAMGAYRSEGHEYTDETYERYMIETNGKVPFDEWLRRKKLKEYFQTRSLPGPNWIGWHPAVDLKDVEARYLQSEGFDHHDFDIWGDRMKALARKPYIDEQAIQQLEESDELEENYIKEAKMYNNAKALSGSLRSDSSVIMVNRAGGATGDAYQINISDGRKSTIDGAYEQLGYSRHI